MENKLRKLTIGEKKYLWRLQTSYRLNPSVPYTDYLALVEFRAWIDGRKQTPLTVRFHEPENPVTGTELTYHGIEPNLNRPAYARLLIEAGLAAGWKPEAEALVIDDGSEILARSGIDVGKP